MKKWIAMLATVAVLLSMAACAGEKAGSSLATEQFAEPSEVLGGWTTNDEFANFTLPEGAAAAFDKAMEQLDGVDYAPVAYLGSQVVAGTNHAVLCKSTAVSPDASSKLAIVGVNEDLEGNAEVLYIKEVDTAEAVANQERIEAGMLGGWTHEAASGAGLDETAQAAFDAALDSYTGMGFQPLALLGTQVVAGTNYAILCAGTPTTADPATELVVVVVYAGMDGTNEITSVSPFKVN